MQDSPSVPQIALVVPGWQMPFAGHKAVGDWQALFGVNLRCPHLSWYTMEGEAKRDFPASIFDQSGWWRARADLRPAGSVLARATHTGAAPPGPIGWLH